MCLYISCHSFFLCLSFHSILNLFERVPFLELKKKKTWHFNPSWFLGDISVFSLPRYLSIEFECFFNLFIFPCQTVALTRSCWSKWKSWRRRVSLQQRLGICKLHFNCSARQSRSCLSEPQPITTGHRPCGCRETQQVHATNSIRTPSRHGSVPTYQTVESEASVTPYQTSVCLMHCQQCYSTGSDLALCWSCLSQVWQGCINWTYMKFSHICHVLSFKTSLCASMKWTHDKMTAVTGCGQRSCCDIYGTCDQAVVFFYPREIHLVNPTVHSITSFYLLRLQSLSYWSFYL